MRSKKRALQRIRMRLAHRQLHAVGHGLESHALPDGLQALRAGARVQVRLHLPPERADNRGERLVVVGALVLTVHDELCVPGRLGQAVVVDEAVPVVLRHTPVSEPHKQSFWGQH